MAHDLIGQMAGATTLLYGAVFDDAGWAAAVRALCQPFGSSHAALGFIDRRSGGQALLYGDCEPQFQQLYTDLIGVDPLSESMSALAPGVPLVDEQVIARDAFERSAFFNLWMVPQQQHSIMALKTTARGNINGYFMMNRGGRSRKYDAQDMADLARIGATLGHVLDLRLQFGARMLEQTGQAMSGRSMGWLAVDPAGRLMWTNAMGEALLARPEGALSASQRRLRLNNPSQMRRLTAAIRAASDPDQALRQGTDMIATHPDNGHALAMSILPAENLFVQGLPALRGAYIAVRDLSQRLPAGFEDRVRAMFELTPKEAQLAAALAAGLSLGDAAAARGISVPTARSHLAQVFRKTGSSQQSQLVSLLLALLPLPPLA